MNEQARIDIVFDSNAWHDSNRKSEFSLSLVLRDYLQIKTSEIKYARSHASAYVCYKYQSILLKLVSVWKTDMICRFIA